MKAESLKHLQNLYERTEDKYFKETIEAIIRLESETKSKGKFSMWDYVGKDKIRPVMECIYHDGGFKVATDYHLLISLKEEYDSELEGRLMRKDGTLLDPETWYPKWRDVIPNPELERMSPVVLDFAKVREIENDFKAKVKALGSTYNNMFGYVKVTDKYTFNLQLLMKMVRFMEHIGTNELLVNPNSRRAVLAISGENKGILMPVISVPETSELIYSL